MRRLPHLPARIGTRIVDSCCFGYPYERIRLGTRTIRRAAAYRLSPGEATARENIHLPADFYDQVRECYAERFYRQEALGEYLDVFKGNAYYAFSEENVRPVEYDRDLALCWALDFNVDPMCAVICQIEETKTRPGPPITRP